MSTSMRSAILTAALFAMATACSDRPVKSEDVDATASEEDADTGVATTPNNGNGALYRLSAGYPLGEEPATPVVGDFNGDGFADVVVVHRGSADTQIFLGLGNGAFRQRSESFGRAVEVVAGDFDGDGIDDIAMSSVEPRVEVVLDPVGSATRISLPVPALPDGLAAADFDGDGDVDLAVSIAGTANEPGASVAVFPWDGTTFGAETLVAVALRPQQLAVMGDDLAVLLGTKSALVLSNNGAGTFAASAPFGVGEEVLRFAVIDIDGSGTLDLIAADRGAGTLNAAVDIPGEDAVLLTEVASPFGITTLHANDDDVLDLAVTSVDDRSVVGLVSRPGGTYAPVVFAEVEGAARLGGLVAADLDGDGIDDLIVVQRGDIDVPSILLVFLSSAQGDR